MDTKVLYLVQGNSLVLARSISSRLVALDTSTVLLCSISTYAHKHTVDKHIGTQKPQKNAHTGN